MSWIYLDIILVYFLYMFGIFFGICLVFFCLQQKSSTCSNQLSPFPAVLDYSEMRSTLKEHLWFYKVLTLKNMCIYMYMMFHNTVAIFSISERYSILFYITDAWCREIYHKYTERISRITKQLNFKMLYVLMVSFWQSLKAVKAVWKTRRLQQIEIP